MMDQHEKIIYRPIRLSDNAQLADLVRTSLAAYGLDIPGTAYFDPCLDDLYRYYQEDPGRRYYIVAEDPRGRVAGGVGFDHFDGLQACAEMQKLYVVSDCQRQGIASQLIRRIETIAWERGYRRIYLETHSNLQAALQLYEKAGYRSITRPEFSIHETMDRFLIKELDGNQ